MIRKILLTAAAVVACSASAASAQSINNFSNTGINNAWTVSYGSTTETAVKVTNPVSPLANTATSNWISTSTASPQGYVPSGQYTYSTNFTVTGGPVTQAFRFAADDAVVSAFLDNVVIAPAGAGGNNGLYGNFTQWSAGAFTAGVGSHVLSFVTTNLGGNSFNAGYFRLEAVAGAVPEPTTWAMMIVGFAAVGVAMRRTTRRSNSAIKQIA